MLILTLAGAVDPRAWWEPAAAFAESEAVGPADGDIDSTPSIKTSGPESGGADHSPPDSMSSNNTSAPGAAGGDDNQPDSTLPEASVPEPAGAELAPILIEADEGRRDQALPQRSFETPEDVAGFGETITADTAWRSFESASELLSRSVGAQLRRQGGRDDFSSLSIRGAPSGQLRILLDGVSIGRASDSVVNLADLPLDTVERIEIYRGFAPVSLSPASAAGVVNVVTRDPKKPTMNLGAGLGSFGSGKINAGAAAPLAGGAASAFASLRTTDGDFEYEDDNGTLNNPFDDRTRKRANNDSNAVDALTRWKGPIWGELQAQLRNHVFYKDEGVPGLARFSPPKARLETIRNIAVASLGAPGKGWSIEEGVTHEREELSDFGTIDNVGRTTASATTARWNRALGKSHWISGSSEVVWEGFEQRFTKSAKASSDADRWSVAAAAGDDWTIDTLDTTVSLQLRHQELWNGFDASLVPGGGGSDRSTDPRLGLRWEPIPGLALKSNVSTYFRPPNFDELFGTNGFTEGNPDLEPEQGTAYDAGFQWATGHPRLGDFALGYSWFGSDIDDVILIVPVTVNRTAKAFNIGRAKVRGHEASFEWKGPWGLAVSANYTFQDAENRSSNALLRGNQLPGLAPHEAYGRASWEWKRFVFAYDVDVSSEHYIEVSNVGPRLPTRVVHGASVVWGPFWNGFRVTLEADNLGDTLVPDEIGYPLPGRAFYATLSWSGSPTGAGPEETNDAR